jgi:hypothetical protein
VVVQQLIIVVGGKEKIENEVKMRRYEEMRR